MNIAAGGMDPAITLTDTLSGVRYMSSTYIHNKLPELSYDLMERLCTALLHHMKETEAGWHVHPQLTPNAITAFRLFGEFLDDVKQFQEVQCDS